MIRTFNDYGMLGHNTFGMDVKARLFVEYDSVADLEEVFASGICEGMKTFHIGGGSNVLFTADYDGAVLHSAIKGIEVEHETDDEVVLSVGPGVVWDDFVAYCVEHSWWGVENLSLIPGEVGASAVQNIGAYGAEAKDVITEVETFDTDSLCRRTFRNDECEYVYRNSFFKRNRNYIVTRVHYRLGKHPAPRLDYGNIRTALGDMQPTAANIRNVVIEIRKSKLPDPAVTGNGGSFFMNPVVSREKYEALAEQYPGMPHYVTDGGVKIPAGWMIEQCGWKGKSLGRAGVHDKQALVLVNLGGASGREVLALCDAVRHDVLQKFGIEIFPEVNVL